MPTESELIQRAIGRDAGAFGELYRQNLTRIYRYIYYRIGQSSDAEDLTEQTFLKAWEAIDRFRDQGVPFSAWLYRLAHNLIIDFRRTSHEAAPIEDLQEMEAAQRPLDELAAGRIEEREVLLAIARLTPEQQQVIILRFIQGMSHADVAAILGKNEGAVRVVQHRALQALHALLAGRIEPR